MGKFGFVVAAVALFACGSDNKAPPDARKPDAAIDAKVFNDAAPDAPPMFDLSCIGNSAPTTANATVTVSGTVTEVGAGVPPTFTMLQGATVDACTAGAANCNGGNKLKTSTSAANGSFSDGPIMTGGTPLAAYLMMTPGTGHTTDRTVLVYPGAPFTADLSGVPVLTFTPAVITELAALPGGCNQQAGNGMLGLAVTDCMNKPITDGANIALSITQGGTAVAGTMTIDLGAVSPMAAGTYLICNVPPNPTTSVGATYKAMTFLTHDVAVTAGTTTATQVRPGY